MWNRDAIFVCINYIVCVARLQKYPDGFGQISIKVVWILCTRSLAISLVLLLSIWTLRMKYGIFFLPCIPNAEYLCVVVDRIKRYSTKKAHCTRDSHIDSDRLSVDARSFIALWADGLSAIQMKYPNCNVYTLMKYFRAYISTNLRWMMYFFIKKGEVFNAHTS